MPDDVDSIRDAVSEAWTKLEAAPEAPAAVADAPSAQATPEPQQAAEPASDGRVRDEQGRFTAKEKPAAASNGTPPARASDAGAQGEAVKDAPGGPPAAAAAPAAPPAPVSEKLKAPQSWTQEERAAFDLAPAAAQKAALRREAEITRALNETAEPRKLKEAVAPYEHLFRGAGLSTPQAVGNVLQKYAQLQTAPLQVRAQILGELTRTCLGTDENAINLLAAALESRPGAAPAQTFGPEQIQAMVQQTLQQERSVAQTEHAKTLAQQFQATAPEHLAAVKDDMVDNLANWERRNPGAQATMEVFQQAYQKACWTNETIRAIEKQKEEAQKAATANAATQKSRASAVSVKSNPAGPSAPPPIGDDTRSHVAAAWDRAANQQ